MKGNGSNTANGHVRARPVTSQKIGRASARQRAAGGALWVHGRINVVRSVANAARLFGCSQTYIHSALRELRAIEPEPVRPVHEAEPVAELHH